MAAAERTAVDAGFCIAGYRFQLALPPHPLVRSILEAWRPFTVSGEPFETRFEVELTSQSPRPPGWAPLMPAVTAAADGGLRMVGAGYEATATADRRVVRVLQTAERFPLEAAIRVLLAEWLAARNGLLLHSAGVASGSSAAVFTGPSGAGKSTLARCAGEGGLSRLSDELVAISPGEGGPVAEGTPWNVGSPGARSLRLLGCLAHADRARLEPVPQAELFRLLLPNVLLPGDTPATRAKAFQLASTLVTGVRSARLHFAPAPAVAAVLRAALESAAA